MPLLEGRTLARLGRYERSHRQGWQPVHAENRTPEDVSSAALFGDTIRLDGVTLVDETLSSGEEIELTLFWQATESVPFDYSVFTHLVDTEDNKAAQFDWQPRDQYGPLPMTSWPVGMQVVDQITLPLPETTPAGSYRLIVGVYDWQDGARLPVSPLGVEGVLDDGEAVIVAEIQVQ